MLEAAVNGHADAIVTFTIQDYGIDRLVKEAGELAAHRGLRGV